MVREVAERRGMEKTTYESWVSATPMIIQCNARYECVDTIPWLQSEATKCLLRVQPKANVITFQSSAWLQQKSGLRCFNDNLCAIHKLPTIIVI